MNDKITIGIDLGGTRIKAIAIDTEGNVLQQLYHPTADGEGAVWKKSVADVVNEFLEKLKINQCLVGISAPGLPNEENTAIAFMPGRMDGLENFDWSNFLQQKTYVLNDAVAALMAESKFGAAINKKNVAMLTLGTGVG
ncbi:MAG: ROK family protein, partial [Sphingobacteriales bacterium]|nr:ROK family protein [Sphingobacteriales bacterium]